MEAAGGVFLQPARGSMLDAARAKMDEQRNLRFIPGYIARISIGSCEPESRVE